MLFNYKTKDSNAFVSIQMRRRYSIQLSILHSFNNLIKKYDRCFEIDFLSQKFWAVWISDTFIYSRQNEKVVVLAKIIEFVAIPKRIIFISWIQSKIEMSLYLKLGHFILKQNYVTLRVLLVVESCCCTQRIFLSCNSAPSLLLTHPGNLITAHVSLLTPWSIGRYTPTYSE